MQLPFIIVQRRKALRESSRLPPDQLKEWAQDLIRAVDAQDYNRVAYLWGHLCLAKAKAGGGGEGKRTIFTILKAKN